MTKTKEKSSLIILSAVAIFGISACAQQLWTVTYPAPNNYASKTYELAIDLDNNIIAEGRVNTSANSNALFIAKYNDNGEMLWDHLLPSYDAAPSSVSGTSMLEVDDNGGIFLSGINSNDMSLKAQKLSAQGELLWEKDFLFEDKLADIAISQDGSHYILIELNGTQSIIAFDAEGNDLWQYDINTTILASRLIEGFSTGHMEINVNGQIVANLGDKLLVLNSDGSLHQSITAASVNVDYFLQHSIYGDRVAVFGYDRPNGNGTAFILDTNLSVLNSYSTGEVISWAGIALINENTACIAFQTGSGGDYGQLIAGVINNDTMEWSQELLNATQEEIAYHGLISVTANQQHCYYSMAEILTDSTLTSYTYRYNTSGSLKDTIKLNKFSLTSQVLSGNNIYTGGFTGNYPSEIATIIKHKFN